MITFSQHSRFILPACGLLFALVAVRSGLPSRLVEPLAQRDAELVVAVRRGDVEEVRAALRKGANVNAKDASGQYVLSLAAESPVTATINAISANGRCVTIQKHRGYAPIIAALLEQGANVRVRNQSHLTPLQQAQDSDEADVVHLLQQAGAIE